MHQKHKKLTNQNSRKRRAPFIAAHEYETFEKGILILTELGLSAIQAKVYLALAQSTESTATVVADISGVARPDVYRVLAQLEKMGLVQTIVANPNISRLYR